MVRYTQYCLPKSSFHGKRKWVWEKGDALCEAHGFHECSVLWKSVGGADLDSLAAAAVHNAAVSASSWPESKWCGRRGRRWRGGRWWGLSLFQKSICIQGLQREFVKVVCSCKRETQSILYLHHSKGFPNSCYPFCSNWGTGTKAVPREAALSLYSATIIQVYYLFSQRLYCNKCTMINWFVQKKDPS